MAVGCEMVLVPARQWVGTVFFVKIVTFICQSCYMYLSKLLSVFAKEVLHVVGCEMVPVPARRWVEAGRAARLARSVGTDLGESREHPQFWKVESREDQVRGWVVLTLFVGQFLTLKIVKIVTLILKPLKGRSAVHSCQSCV